MKSFIEYLSEALTKAQIAKAKANMAKIAKQVMAKKPRVRAGGMNWKKKETSGWWHESMKPIEFKWKSNNTHVNVLVKNHKAMGIDKKNVDAMVNRFMDETDARETYTFDQVYKQFMGSGEVDAYGPMANLAYQKGWVQFQLLENNIEMGGSERPVKMCIREIVEMTQDAPVTIGYYTVDSKGKFVNSGSLRTIAQQERFANS